MVGGAAGERTAHGCPSGLAGYSAGAEDSADVRGPQPALRAPRSLAEARKARVARACAESGGEQTLQRKPKRESDGGVERSGTGTRHATPAACSSRARRSAAAKLSAPDRAIEELSERSETEEEGSQSENQNNGERKDTTGGWRGREEATRAGSPGSAADLRGPEETAESAASPSLTSLIDRQARESMALRKRKLPDECADDQIAGVHKHAFTNSSGDRTLAPCLAAGCGRPGVANHPSMPLPLCDDHCRAQVYRQEHGWPKDEDGTDALCRWCCGLDLDAVGDAGKEEVVSLLCDRCGCAWCASCLGSALGSNYVEKIMGDEEGEWLCPLCKPALVKRVQKRAARARPSPNAIDLCDGADMEVFHRGDQDEDFGKVSRGRAFGGRGRGRGGPARGRGRGRVRPETTAGEIGACLAAGCGRPGVANHPSMPLPLCDDHCRAQMYRQEHGWPKDEDGTDALCRWCCGLDLDAVGDAGKEEVVSLLCDRCGCAWCASCLGSALGSNYVEKIMGDEEGEWLCPLCKPALVKRVQKRAARARPSPNAIDLCDGADMEVFHRGDQDEDFGKVSRGRAFGGRGRGRGGPARGRGRGRVRPETTAGEIGACLAAGCGRPGVANHPSMPLPLCDDHCRAQVYRQEHGWPKDEDGTDALCRWCCGLDLDAVGDAGKEEVVSLLCDRCGCAWCASCLGSALGSNYVEKIMGDEEGEWLCPLCKPALVKRVQKRAARARPSPNAIDLCDGADMEVFHRGDQDEDFGKVSRGRAFGGRGRGRGGPARGRGRGRVRPETTAGEIGACLAAGCGRPGVANHPSMPLPLCDDHCRAQVYRQEHGWPKDEDGTDALCRWCCGLDLDAVGDAGKEEVVSLLCDRCGCAWCASCLGSALGSNYVEKIMGDEEEEWLCPLCKPALVKRVQKRIDRAKSLLSRGEADDGLKNPRRSQWRSRGEDERVRRLAKRDSQGGRPSRGDIHAACLGACVAAGCGRRGVEYHPLVPLPLCDEHCRAQAYWREHGWPQDEDGTDARCRGCCGLDLNAADSTETNEVTTLLCDDCCMAWCAACLSAVLGAEYMNEIIAEEGEWRCLMCDRELFDRARAKLQQQRTAEDSSGSDAEVESDACENSSVESASEEFSASLTEDSVSEGDEEQEPRPRRGPGRPKLLKLTSKAQFVPFLQHPGIPPSSPPPPQLPALPHLMPREDGLTLEPSVKDEGAIPKLRVVVQTDQQGGGSEQRIATGSSLSVSAGGADAILANAGAPVWCMAWMPRPDDGGAQILAVGTHRMNASHALSSGLNEISLWEVATGAGERTASPLRLQSFVLHDGGGALDLCWCPAGNAAIPCDGMADGTLPRLGLLAVACADGAVRIFAIPDALGLAARTARDQPPRIRLAPAIQLAPASKSLALCLAWRPGAPFGILAVGRADGSVQLWDLAADTDPSEATPHAPTRLVSSPHTLLGQATRSAAWQNGELGATADMKLDVATITGHFGPVRTMAWLPAQRPLLATGGHDGMCFVWDPAVDVWAPRQRHHASIGWVTDIEWAHACVPASGKASDAISFLVVACDSSRLLVEPTTWVPGARRGFHVPCSDTGGVWSLALSAAGDRLAIATSEGRLQIAVEVRRSSGAVITQRALVQLDIEDASSGASATDREETSTVRVRLGSIAAVAPTPAPNLNTISLEQRRASLRRVQWCPSRARPNLLACAGAAGMIVVTEAPSVSALTGR